MPALQPATNGLRQLRYDRGLTIEALSAQSGVHIATISLLERGRLLPQLETIIKLARGLEISPHRLRDALAAPAPAVEQRPERKRPTRTLPDDDLLDAVTELLEPAEATA